MSDTLENYCQQFIAGVVGLPGSQIRPRWQAEPPNLPPFGSDWAACGITRKRPLGIYAWVVHEPDGPGDGTDNMSRHEEFDLLVSFYGPNADVYSSNLADGLSIWQNKSELALNQMAFVEVTESIRMPEMIKNYWVERVDKTVVLRRCIQRRYAIRNVLSASGTVNTDTPPYSQSFHTP